MKRFILILCASLGLFSASAFEVDSVPLHLKLAGMKRAQAPEVFEDYLILSAQGPYRFVGAAFEDEGFTTIHAFEKNRQGIFVLIYPVPLKCSHALAYRLIVDGAWTIDPVNPLKEDARAAGVELSLAPVPFLSDERPGLYHVLENDGRTAHFLFKGESGLQVTVEGSFNNWDPFLHEMAETSPGVYELELELPRGLQYYDFVYNGESHPDRLNLNKASNREGKIVSYLQVQ